MRNRAIGYMQVALSFIQQGRTYKQCNKSPLSRAKTIARTEGHRIQQASWHNSSVNAKEHGADLVRKWDATLDGKTRPAHRILDGQIVEVDEPFEVYGSKAMYPGEFGDPALDINCRCIAKSIPRFLAEGSFSKMDNFTKEIRVFNSPKEYEEFKKQYWSKENLDYMKYVDTLEKRYGTKNFNTLLEKMTDREYQHFHKLEAESPMWKTTKETLENLEKSSTIAAETNVVKDAISTGAVLTTINVDKQSRHILSSDKYTEGRSYIKGTIEDAQKLVDELSGTGSPIIDTAGNWTNKERVKSASVIGVHIDPSTQTKTETANGTIIYSKTGSHIVPRKEDDK